MIRALTWSLAAIIWIAFLALPWGKLPALGPLLDLKSGVWDHHEFKWRDQTLKGLIQPVQVAIDKNGVPHLFAANEADLYRAQGFVIASQRLFQMDASTRSMSGHLSELIGPKGADLDRFFIRFGMRQGEATLHEALLKDPQMRMMIENFVGGVNEYIAHAEQIPVEYKLLGRKPKPMTSHIVSRMAKTMTYSLSGGSSDYFLSHLRQTLSVAQILDLFPEFLPPEYEDFVFPSRAGAKPRTPEAPEQFTFQTHIKDFPKIPAPPPFNGSNNWVVGPKKSATGHSILANDTHLGLSLPNVWFENQLSCPQFNVYGVSFPAVPGIVNGFNAWTAWGPTNGTTDALDFYEIEFLGDSSFRYKVGEGVEEAKVFEEVLGDERIIVPWTKWGPVLHREGHYGLVANWTGHRAGEELKALRHLYDGKTAKDCLSSFQSWQVPIQNFVCADQDHFGLIHAGFIGRRAIGEGRFVGTPQGSQGGLQERVPEQPMAYDPPQGYLRSANQRVMGPEFPYYMGWNYEEPFRGRAIRRLLEGQEKLSGADFIKIQNDNYDTEAEMILPVLLKTIRPDGLTPEQKLRLEELQKWDLHVHAADVSPSLYKEWYKTLKHKIFSDEYTLPERPGLMPKDVRLAWMLKRVSENPKDSDANWIDDKKTPTVETLADVVTSSFHEAWALLASSYGPSSEQWTWRRWIKTQLPHFAKIPGFGSDVLAMDGGSDSVRGNRGWHGAVYKFVIELGATPRAWMQVPGGNSGDPFSPRFERFVQDWARGDMREVEFYADLADAKRRAVQVIELKPERP